LEKNSDRLKLEILQLTKEYYQAKKNEDSIQESQVQRIQYAGRVYDDKEMVNLIDASLEFWLTSGSYTKQFERGFAHFLGIKHCYTCNSGSSANLLAFMALTSPLLGDRRILPGDEVITVAAGFPTTVAPIIQYGAIPVFIDISIPQYNIDCTQLDEAWTPKTKAVMIAHTLGNPFDLGELKKWCQEHQLWLIDKWKMEIYWNHRRHRNIQFLPTSSYDDGRRRGCLHRQPSFSENHSIFKRLGKGLLLSIWCR
jgi:CDP-4-dehydro-6-deoxyglucose reductase, E1